MGVIAIIATGLFLLLLIMFFYSLNLWTSRKNVPSRPWAWIVGWILGILGGLFIIFTFQNTIGLYLRFEPSAAQMFLLIFGIPGILLSILGWVMIVLIAAPSKNAYMPTRTSSNANRQKAPTTSTISTPTTGGYCTNCGTKLDMDAVFCLSCGARNSY